MFRYATAGESHGKGLAAFVEGVPAGFPINESAINAELVRRQGGYGRGGRQSIEQDSVEVLTGILHGKSMGSPILLWVKNRDYKIETMVELTRPRPGHADLAGSVKYRSGIRPILERSSARETAARVAAGAMAADFLKVFGIDVVGFVTSIGPLSLTLDNLIKDKWTPEQIRKQRNASLLYSIIPELDDQATRLIDEAQNVGDTLGGIIEVRAYGLPFGLGSHAEASRKLDARLANVAMSIQAIKGVEIGLGFETARLYGSNVHDVIRFAETAAGVTPSRFIRPTNRAGGIEGGISNSKPIVLRAAMKPIATLKKSLESVDFLTKKTEFASYERSDVCAVSAASVILENVVAFELASALFEKLGGDSLDEMMEHFKLLQKRNSL